MDTRPESETCGWWVLSDDALRVALDAAAAGEPVDLVLLSLYANSDVRTVGDDDA